MKFLDILIFCLLFSSLSSLYPSRNYFIFVSFSFIRLADVMFLIHFNYCISHKKCINFLVPEQWLHEKIAKTEDTRHWWDCRKREEKRKKIQKVKNRVEKRPNFISKAVDMIHIKNSNCYEAVKFLKVLWIFYVGLVLRNERLPISGNTQSWTWSTLIALWLPPNYPGSVYS